MYTLDSISSLEIAISPTDIITCRVREQLSPTQLRNLKYDLIKMFPDNKVIITGDGISLDIYKDWDDAKPYRKGDVVLLNGVEMVIIGESGT